VTSATYETDPAAWSGLDWRDRRSGKPVRILTLAGRPDPDVFAEAAAGGAVVVETIGRVLGRYIHRPEHKSLAPDRCPAGPATVGLLQRRPVYGHRDKTSLIGKEGNRLLERVSGEVDSAVE
jgi:hypothetical protein